MSWPLHTSKFARGVICSGVTPIFGRDAFINEIIWAYDYGAKPKNRWPAKHDTIFFYAKNPASYVFNAAQITREPYMAPGLVTPEKAARGKLPTDVWWHTIVGTSSREKTGYPTQKPLGVLRRIIVPLVKPGIVAGSILVFIPSLGAYVIPRVLGGGKSMMLGNLIEMQFGAGRNWPLGAAISITLMVIVTAALLLYVRYASRSGARHG